MLPLVSQQQGKAVWWQVPAPQFLFGLAASLSEADTLARFAAATDATLAALSAGPAAAAEMRSSAGQLVRAAAGSPHVIATVLHEIRACQPHACALRARTKKCAQTQPLPPAVLCLRRSPCLFIHPYSFLCPSNSLARRLCLAPI